MTTDDTYLVMCSIFDDGDVLPTVVITEYSFAEMIVPVLNELRTAAEHQYGRRAPDHAVFWESLGARP